MRCLLIALLLWTSGAASFAAAVAPADKPITLPEWRGEAGARQAFEIGTRQAAVWGGGDRIARIYPAEWLPAIFKRTLEIETLSGSGLEWIFTGPRGGFTVSLGEGSVTLAQRYYDSYALGELKDGKPVAARHPERRWLTSQASYSGALKAVTVELGANMQVVVRLNGREALRQACLLDVTQHQLRLTSPKGAARVALVTPPARHATLKVDPAQKHQAILGFGGIGTPMAYAMLSPEGKRRWWELVAEYNLLIQREYPIGTRLNPAMDNWDNLADATPHYYADNFPNGEVSDFGYIRAIRKLGGMVMFEFWGLPPWIARNESGRPKLDCEKYAQAVVGYCRASQLKAGAPPEIVGVQNEVAHPAEEYRQMTLALRRALDQAGFSAVKIHLSDDSRLSGGVARAQASRASTAAWRATDYTASHVYDYQSCLEDPDRFDATIARWNEAARGKPFISTEICINDSRYQVASYRLALGMGQLYHKNLAQLDAVALCYCWTLLNVTQPSYGATRSLFVPDPLHGFVPAPSSAQLRVFGAFSRRLKRGMTRLEAATDDKDLLATAFADADGATVVLLNRGLTRCTTSIDGLAGFKEMEIVDPYHENAVSPAPAGEITLEPGAIVTLTSKPLGRLPEGFSAE